MVIVLDKMGEGCVQYPHIRSTERAAAQAVSLLSAAGILRRIIGGILDFTRRKQAMKMEKPTAEVVRFQNSDVIATSGQPAVQPGVQLGNFYNGTRGDWFASNVKGATSGTQDQSTILGYFNAASGQNFTTYYQIILDSDSSDGISPDPMDDILPNPIYYEEAYSSAGRYNGWYIWDSANKYFVKQ